MVLRQFLGYFTKQLTLCLWADRTLRLARFIGSCHGSVAWSSRKFRLAVGNR